MRKLVLAKSAILLVALLTFTTACEADDAKKADSKPLKLKPWDPKKPVDKKNLKQRLTKLQYYVTQENGTERPFQNKYWNNKGKGIYVDIVSGEPLFSSKDKFKSGTGWPSFTKPLIKTNVVEKKDTTFGMVRVEVRSLFADSHLGHVFDDGPAPTGKRYCINSASLVFVPAADLQKFGYGQFCKDFGITPKSPKAASQPVKKPAADANKSEANKSDAMNKVKANQEVAYVAAGCFWCTEAIFEAQPGVISVISGYAGGSKKDPTYQQVCTGTTGHTETIKIIFDPSKTNLSKLLKVFWKTFDATDGRGVEPDFGTQYRPVVFYTNDKQKQTAEASKKAEQANHKKPVQTEILPLKKFYEAEKYHQDFVKRNPSHPYVKGVSYKRMDMVGVKHP